MRNSNQKMFMYKAWAKQIEQSESVTVQVYARNLADAKEKMLQGNNIELTSKVYRA